MLNSYNRYKGSDSTNIDTGSEGVIRADKISITRSVISTALRKLEMAGIIETRNCGARGTRILILDQHRLEQILEAIA